MKPAMKYEVKKITKIVDEVLTFFIYNYGAEAHLEISFGTETARLKFRFAPVEIEADEYRKLEKRFTVSRHPELEDYYWQLAGEIEDSNEITLVGMMCDTCEMKLENKVLEMELTRKLK